MNNVSINKKKKTGQSVVDVRSIVSVATFIAIAGLILNANDDDDDEFIAAVDEKYFPRS